MKLRLRIALALLCCIARSLAFDLGLRIVGGHFANENQFPHQVAIIYRGNLRCGGSIINHSWILTAAHCLLARKGIGLSICAGTTSINECKVKRNVTKAIPHKKHGNYINDIALLKLDEPLEFDESISAIELSIKEIPVKAKVTIMGWGRIYHRGPTSVFLKYNKVRPLNQNDCARATAINYKGLICLDHSWGNGACNGDSGGSAIYKNKLVGVANFVNSGCGSNSPDGYAKVSYFYNWIQEHMHGYHSSLEYFK